MRIESDATPILEGELLRRRKYSSRDLTPRIIIFLNHVRWEFFWIGIAVARQHERSTVAVLHPAGFRIHELRQLVDGVISLPLRRRIAAIAVSYTHLRAHETPE